MKQQKKKYLGTLWVLLPLLVLMLVLCFLAVMGQPEFEPLNLLQSIAVSVLCSIIASILFCSLQAAISKDDQEERIKAFREIDHKLDSQMQLYASGIVSLRKKSYYDENGTFWLEMIESTSDHLDMVGHSCNRWFDEEFRKVFIRKIEKMAKRGQDVRIVLSGKRPDMQKVKKTDPENKAEADLTKLEHTCVELYQIWKVLPKKKRKHLKVYLADRSVVTHMYIRTDNSCFVSPYVLDRSNYGNSFLLEIKENTEYSKCFENNFNDLLRSKYTEKIEFGGKMIKKKVYHTTNTYSGSDWNREKTTKYVFEIADHSIEAGYFEHYRDDVLVKTVIELPQSYGCPSKCKFCASSAIEEFQLLTADEMMELFEYIYDEMKLETNPYVLLTMTGMGDLYFNFDNVMEFLQRVGRYRNIYITVSSCLWNVQMLKRMESLSDQLRIRNIQITYVSHDQETLEAVIPFYQKIFYDFEALLEYIRHSAHDYYRINYIMIRNINDSMDAFKQFQKMITPAGHNIVVRISKLNETRATKRNDLYPTEVSALETLQRLLEKSCKKSYIFYANVNDNMNCGQLITESGEI